MAIQINLTADKTTIGADASSAYARIAQVDWNRYSGLVEVKVDVFWNRAARDARKAPIWGNVYRAKLLGATDQGGDPAIDELPPVPNLNPDTLYNWLETLPDFTGGTQV